MILERFPQINELTLEEKQMLFVELEQQLVPVEEPDPVLVAAIERRIARNNAHPELWKTHEEFMASFREKNKKTSNV